MVFIKDAKKEFLDQIINKVIPYFVLIYKSIYNKYYLT